RLHVPGRCGDLADGPRTRVRKAGLETALPRIAIGQRIVVRDRPAGAGRVLHGKLRPAADERADVGRGVPLKVWRPRVEERVRQLAARVQIARETGQTRRHREALRHHDLTDRVLSVDHAVQLHLARALISVFGAVIIDDLVHAEWAEDLEHGTL